MTAPFAPGPAAPVSGRRRVHPLPIAVGSGGHDSLLDPDAVLRADRAAVRAAAANREKGTPLLAPEVRGGRAVANALVGRAQAAQVALIDGMPGAVWAPGGRPRAIFAFQVVGSTIIEIEIVTDPSVVAALPVQLL
ncbi:MAG: hypothetical protein ACYDAD_13215 [Acidimicrobiales bacterium]